MINCTFVSMKIQDEGIIFATNAKQGTFFCLSIYKFCPEGGILLVVACCMTL